MGNGDIDRLPVNQLMERYSLVKSAVYTRLESLGIKPERVGNKSYVNADQLELLDEFHRFITAGGTTPEFLDMKGLSRATETSSEQSSGLSTVQPDIIRLVTAIAAEMASRFQPQAPQADQFAYFETLERAAQNGWLLKTSEVAHLLQLDVSEFQYYGDRFSEAGFVFTKAGYRSGGEVAWRVSKAVR